MSEVPDPNQDSRFSMGAIEEDFQQSEFLVPGQQVFVMEARTHATPDGHYFLDPNTVYSQQAEGNAAVRVVRIDDDIYMVVDTMYERKPFDDEAGQPTGSRPSVRTDEDQQGREVVPITHDALEELMAARR